VPERYGPPTTIYNRFNRWRKAGIWDRLMDAIIAAHDGKVQMIDSTVVRVHQQAAAQKKQAGDACIGRSRGGLTTKLHVRVVGNGLPVQLELSPGQANDAPMAELLLNDLPRGAVVLADRAYDANWIREVIEDRRGQMRDLLREKLAARASADRNGLLAASLSCASGDEAKS
jgi:transposase